MEALAQGLPGPPALCLRNDGGMLELLQAAMPHGVSICGSTRGVAWASPNGRAQPRDAHAPEEFAKLQNPAGIIYLTAIRRGRPSVGLTQKARHDMSIMGNSGGTLTRQVITTLDRDGKDVMSPKVVAWKFPDESITSGSLLTVESNHFAVLKSRGAVLNVYETGQYPITTPDKPILGSIVQGFFGGQSPWQYEAIFVQRSKLRVQNSGVATSAEMAEMVYQTDYYIHVDTKDEALKLVTHMPFDGHFITTDEVAAYAGPVIEQAINQIVQVTPMEQINERVHDIVELCKQHLAEFLGVYGILLNDLKLLVMPRDERMRELISLRAFGLTPMEAVRYYTALKMAEKGLVSAPNAAVGQPFQIGGALGTFNAGGMTDIGK